MHNKLHVLTAAKPMGRTLGTKLFRRPQGLLNYFLRETTTQQKADLFRFLGGIGGRGAEFLLPHFARALEFAVAVLAQYRFNDVVAHAALAQVVGELDAARAGAVVGDVAFGEAAVGQPVLGFELVQQGADVLADEAAALELAREFGAAVFAPRQQGQGAGAQVCGAGLRAGLRPRLHPRPLRWGC